MKCCHVSIHKNILSLILMQKHNNIKALLFLGIFSLLLLHQVLPHWHHEHEVGHTHHTVAHHDSHSHHHHAPKKESPIKGFLDLFLEMHVHSVVANELLLIHQDSKKHIEVTKDTSTPFTIIHYHSTINYDEVEKIKVYHPPNNYFNTYLSSLDTRGPPALG
jgi:hypothetical protein